MNKKDYQTTEKGQSLVELAISFVFLMLLLAGVVNLGQAFFTYMALRDAAQEGAAYASVARDGYRDPLPCNAITSRVRNSSTNPIVDLTNTTDIAVDVVYVHSGGTKTICGGVLLANQVCFNSSNAIEVTVRYENFPMTVPFLGALIGQTIPIRATVVDTLLTPACQ